MLNKIIKILSDVFKDTSLDKVSHMRVLTAFTVIVPILTWVVYVFVKGWVEPSESMAILVVGAIAGKVVQKKYE